MSDMKITTTTDGVKIKYWEGRLPGVGEYGLYKGLFYMVTSSSSVGVNMVYTLERDGLRIIYKPWKNQEKLSIIMKFYR